MNRLKSALAVMIARDDAAGRSFLAVRREALLLIVVWAMLFIPYIISGGLLRDDLGYLPQVREYASYGEFQQMLSSEFNMTARPVSALLHGLAYWHFGGRAWAFHLLNLLLFLGSILLFHRALHRWGFAPPPLLVALSALVYPTASSTVFSSFMMNSNLAALFWATALLVGTKNFRGRSLLIFILLTCSALSYEAFIPLFALNLAIGAMPPGSPHVGGRSIWKAAFGVIAALALFAFYRVFLEEPIFGAKFSRIVFHSPYDTAVRAIESIYRGAKIFILDSFRISFRAAGNLGLLSAADIAMLALVMPALTLMVFRVLHAGTRAWGGGAPSSKAQRSARHAAGGAAATQLKCIAFTVLLFLLAHGMYTFSEYWPEASGFDNRTLGGARFAGALLMAALASYAHGSARGRIGRGVVTAAIVGVLLFFLLSMSGQREAWIAAARCNEKVISGLDAALKAEHPDQADSLTVIIVMPEHFEGQVNHEPVLGKSWDAIASISLEHPRLAVHANVLDRSATAGEESVTLHEDWRARYPFYVFLYDEGRLRRISSRGEWENLARALPALRQVQ